MIFDVFLFKDEFFHLECRMHELEGVVDRFVAIEGSHTLSGDEKPFLLRERRERYNKYPLDIIEVDLTWLDGIPTQEGPWVQPGTQERWKRDLKQREAATKMINEVPEDTVFIMGDVDEIPRRRTIEEFDGVPSVLMMRHLIYSLHYADPEPWAASVIGTKKDLKTFQRARYSRWAYRHIDDAGWHLAWFGGELAIEKKVKEFAHGEMLDKAKEIAEIYTRQHVKPSGMGALERYEGDLPMWVEEGSAPNSWKLEW